MRHTLLATSLVATVAQASTADYFFYNQNGEDWGAHVSNGAVCGSGMEQSPINLFKYPTESTPEMAINGFGYRNYMANDRMIVQHPSTIEMPFTDG